MVPFFWAVDASESALYLVEVALGRFSSGLAAEWGLPDGFDADEVAARMPDAPEVWSDGSLVLDSVIGVSAAGAALFAHQSGHCWSDRRWRHLDRFHLDQVPHSCRRFVSVPGLLQTVQRAELWRSFLLFSLPTPFMWRKGGEGDNQVLLGMLDACWMVAIVLSLLSLLLMVIFLY